MSYDDFYIGDGHLKPGKELIIRTSAGSERVEEIAELVKLPRETVIAKLEASIEAEKKAVKMLSDAVADEWEPHARATAELMGALEYLRTLPAKHSSNKWIDNGGFYDYRISNMVYVMRIHAYEKTERVNGKYEVTGWYVSWSIYLNCPQQNSYGSRIAGQDKKLYRDKVAAVKYLQGRCEEYSPLFAALSPPIPEKYADHFKVNGVLLPGYIIDGEQTHAKVLLELEEELAPSSTPTKAKDMKHRHMGQSHTR
ncbi:hypothetical protein [Pseudoflavonifractor phocaeensis]|uniref:hypothetical protein n=1 Tax=Pseudoflavonifractor phocaeensis TaxID=1870988 RepID=UPI00210D76BA|nr:hypothetical protein [Pseudoflavonifractor phocaeensis]MCQ4866171.1 hypothetical protein [Pseudoflavonifractor phocaeensis]